MTTPFVGLTDLDLTGAIREVAPHADAEAYGPPLAQAASGKTIDTPLRVAHWLGQIHVETQGFTAFVENLNYSAERLVAVWPHRFPNVVVAAPFAHNPEALADKVYGGRMGNVRPGDGWLYRGRGAGLTGRDNYTRFGVLIGADLEADPDLAEQPDIFAKVAAAYWKVNGLNAPADRDDVVAVTESWNGGLTDLTARKAALAAYKTALGVAA